MFSHYIKKLKFFDEVGPLSHYKLISKLLFCVILLPKSNNAALFQLSQHMKLKLQFTASVSNPPPEARPLSRKNSPSSPAVRDILDRHQASLSLGRSQSFSHQQPSKSHLTRYGVKDTHNLAHAPKYLSMYGCSHRHLFLCNCVELAPLCYPQK